MRTDMYQHTEKLKEYHFPLKAESLRDVYLDGGQKYKMLLEIFQEHNNQVTYLVGQDFAKGTAEHYRTFRSHLAEYIQFEYKRKDIPEKHVDHAFITGISKYATKI
ncbi:MAG: hypothetical protein AAGJ12_05640 [Bacteroidota bacterium]